jgi:hypothetical protein
MKTNEWKMRELAGTVTLIASIAVAIVLLLTAPKGFEIAPPDPLVSSRASEASSP